MPKPKKQYIKVKTSTYDVYIRIKSLALSEEEKQELAKYVEKIINEKG